MKKRMVSLILACALVLPALLVTPASAASDTGPLTQIPPYYDTICTASFQNPEHDGRLSLTVHGSGPMSRKLLGSLNSFCDAMSLLGFDFLDGICKVASHGEDILDYLDSQMSVNVCLIDVATDKCVWEGVLKNGDIIYLGNDHPAGYRIKCKPCNHEQTLVRIEVLENLDLT